MTKALRSQGFCFLYPLFYSSILRSMTDPSLLSPLGKPTEYRAQYAPDLLFAIPRQLKRDELGVSAGVLPFVGEDVWNAYEVSWLNSRGKPVVALASFRFSASSPNLIESKSFKLYLNSFNQTVFDNLVAVEALLVRDLSAVSGASVAVRLIDLNCQPQVVVGYPQGLLLDRLEVDCTTYLPDPGLLACSLDEAVLPVEETLYSHLLKSNCLVTGQPDWAMLLIRYRGRPISHEGLLRYIVSFRNHNEFHEQCVERIFCDISHRCRPEALLVHASYTRRGGLDINPWRSSGEFVLPEIRREVRQ